MMIKIEGYDRAISTKKYPLTNGDDTSKAIAVPFYPKSSQLFAY